LLSAKKLETGVGEKPPTRAFWRRRAGRKKRERKK